MSSTSPRSPRSGWCSPAWRAAAPRSQESVHERHPVDRQRGRDRAARLPRRGAAAAGEILVTNHAWLLLAAYSIVLVLLAIPLARWIAHVMDGRPSFATRVESVLWRLCGVRADTDMGWLQYALALLLFNLLGALAVYALQRVQFWLPLNPQALPNVSPD